LAPEDKVKSIQKLYGKANLKKPKAEKTYIVAKRQRKLTPDAKRTATLGLRLSRAPHADEGAQAAAPPA
jgi:hypothetical protein